MGASVHEQWNITYLLHSLNDFQSSSTLDNVDEWRWKLTMLLRNNEEVEVVSREKKDRRDFEQLSALATRMNLHRYFKFMVFFWILFKYLFQYPCYHMTLIDIVFNYSGSRQYSRVVVFSKDPLPNYRPDLDDKRPQREVHIFSYPNFVVSFRLARMSILIELNVPSSSFLFSIHLEWGVIQISFYLQVVLPFGVQREVEGHLRLYQSSHKSVSRGCFSNSYLPNSGIAENCANNNGLFQHQEPSTTQSIVMEKILRRKSLLLRNQQQDWQVFFKNIL